jgi:mannose/fructose/N-acetylgalactosamine-specific phosphotransferase system component IIB
MSLVLTRVDDRLIHGQVVEGWLRVIQATRIVVASDEVADDPLQVNLMSLAVPSDVKVMVLKVQAAADSLKAGSWAKERVLLLLPGLREARRLAAAGVELEALNLGGLHDAPGREPVSPSRALSAQDREDIEFLLSRGVEIETRALPNDERRLVKDVLARGAARARDVRPQ